LHVAIDAFWPNFLVAGKHVCPFSALISSLAVAGVIMQFFKGTSHDQDPRYADKQKKVRARVRSAGFLFYPTYEAVSVCWSASS
jgi:hypothetical protein